MEYRRFGSTDLNVSVVGFGAWGIGGPSIVGSTPIGWGDVDDATSKKALLRAHALGINFIDTADFYGLGHSEELIGEVFNDVQDLIVATKVGHTVSKEQTIALDYSKKHIMTACEQSLRRLRRTAIDYYQLHSAKLSHLEKGECIEAMEQLKKEGKVRYWGISLNTFHPDPEAEFFLERNIGDGFQVVFNIINQRAKDLIKKAHQHGYGVIARMPLQFGLLTGKFRADIQFAPNDHRAFRLDKEINEQALTALVPLWKEAEAHGISKTSLAMSYCVQQYGISTTIPGIKTPAQAEANTAITTLDPALTGAIGGLYESELHSVVALMEKKG